MKISHYSPCSTASWGAQKEGIGARASCDSDRRVRSQNVGGRGLHHRDLKVNRHRIMDSGKKKKKVTYFFILKF